MLMRAELLDADFYLGLSYFIYFHAYFGYVSNGAFTSSWLRSFSFPSATSDGGLDSQRILSVILQLIFLAGI